MTNWRDLALLLVTLLGGDMYRRVWRIENKLFRIEK